MESQTKFRDRRVRLHTSYGVFEGVMHCSPVVRTLDAVNQLATGFVTLQAPVQTPFGPPFGPGPVAVARTSVLYIEELDDAPSTIAGARAGMPRFWKAPLALRVGDVMVHGFVHVPMGGNPLMRLSTNEAPPFLALTSVEAHGPAGEVKSAFLAVNRAHVTAAQEVLDGDEFKPSEEEGAGTQAGASEA